MCCRLGSGGSSPGGGEEPGTVLAVWSWIDSSECYDEGHAHGRGGGWHTTAQLAMATAARPSEGCRGNGTLGSLPQDMAQLNVSYVKVTGKI